MGMLEKWRGPTSSEVQKFKKGLPSQNDKELSQDLEHLSNSLRRLKELNYLMAKMGVGGPDSIIKRVAASIVRAVVPRKMLNWLPNGIVGGGSALDWVEEKMREGIGNTNDAIKNIGERVSREEEELEQLLSDIETAEAEGWDAKRLLEYFKEKTGIAFHNEVSEILDERYSHLLKEKERENRRKRLFVTLRNQARIKLRNLEVLFQVAIGGVDTLTLSVVQFWGFISGAPAIKTLMASAESIGEMGQANFIARDTLIESLNRAIEVTADSIKAVADIPKYSTSGPEVAAALEAARDKINASVVELNQKTDRYLTETAPSQDNLLAGDANGRQIANGREQKSSQRRILKLLSSPSSSDSEPAAGNIATHSSAH